MAFVVTESCIQCKYTDCVQVCPMNCFVEGPNFLAIDPDGCISCSICVPECPVDAIVDEQEISREQAHFVELNRRLSKRADWKSITSSKPPLPEHERWAKEKDKLALLQRDWTK